MAHVSGRLLNSEKLQKYLSANSLSSVISSSGICFWVCAKRLTSRVTLQYMLSMSARVRKSTMPWLNRSSDSSLICWASCQSSRRVRGFRLSQISYMSFTSWRASGEGSKFSSIRGREAVSSTCMMSSDWWADSDRPLSVIRFG